jgi:hypothetical protein
MAVHLIKHTAPCACVVWRRKWWPHYFPLWCVHVVLVSVCAPRFILLWASDIAPLTDRATHTIATSQISRCSTSPVTCSQCPENEFISMLGARCTHGESIEHTLGRCIVHFALISFAACSMCIRVFWMPCEYIYRNILWIQMKLLFCDSYTLITDMRYPIQEQHSRAPRVFMHINKTVSILL